MPLNSGRPIIGRFLGAGWGFLSSTWGLPVAGSIGSFSPTMTPQIPLPHLLTRTRASPAWVVQVPVGSPALWARADGAASNAAKIAVVKTCLQAMTHSLEKTQACIATNLNRATLPGGGGDYLPQGVTRIASAVPRP